MTGHQEKAGKRIARVAVVGATGQVGREILQIMAERDFPADEIVALASEKSIGAEVSYGDDDVLTVADAAKYNFRGCDLVLMAIDSEKTAAIAERALEAGAVVIDSSSCFRMNPDVPLVVPEVNAAELAKYEQTCTIASPSGMATQLALVLKPLHEAAGVKRVVVSTYQAVGERGKEAMDELFSQTRAIYVNDPIEKEHFTKQIAFNVIPHIGAFMEDGVTVDEWALVAETKKILAAPVKVSATCVRVPVFIGSALAVNIELERELSADEARQTLKQMRGISIVDHRADEGYVTPVELAGEDNVFVSRIREDPSLENGLSLWVVADNFRKGAALNIVQIAERMVKDVLE